MLTLAPQCPPVPFRRLFALAGLLVAVALAGLLAPVPVHAATITVDTDDDTDSPLEDGDCSLREAIANANDDAQTWADCPPGSGDDTIIFEVGIASIQLDEDMYTVTDTDGLAINGAGITINGDGSYRIFNVANGAALTVDGFTLTNTGFVSFGGAIVNAGTFTGSNLTITEHDATGSGGAISNGTNGVLTLMNSTVSDSEALGGSGGGILNQGSLTLDNTTVSGNQAAGDGGGINNSINGEVMILGGSVITGNEADGDGGGISNIGQGDVMITDSTVGGNTSGDEGGGLYNAQDGTMTITRSTISGNNAVFGGGLSHEGAQTVTIVNSTISGNEATEHSGGVNMFGDGSIAIESTTITDNTADSDSTGDGDGGGIGTGAGTVQIKNTIIAGNFDPTSDPDCFGTITSAGHNLIQTVSAGCTIQGDSASNITGLDPMLAALANNGGLTDTHALHDGSPAIDAGSDDCPPPDTDQRGLSRPRDGDDDSTALCDIGAYEAPGDPPTPTPSASPSPTPEATPTPSPTASPTPSPTPTPAGPTPVVRELVWADVNCSDVADPVDALITLRFDAGLSVNIGACPPMGTAIEVLGSGVASLGEGDGDPQTWGDADCDESIGPVDALKLLRYDAALSVSQQQGCPPIGSEVSIQHAP